MTRPDFRVKDGLCAVHRILDKISIRILWVRPFGGSGRCFTFNQALAKISQLDFITAPSPYPDDLLQLLPPPPSNT